MASEYVEALPEAREDLAGESIEKGKSNRYAIKVSNARGYLCHIKMEATFEAPPELLFAIFCNPDNTGVFRDIKKRGKRKLIELDPAGRKIVEIEQVGEAKVLFKRWDFSTLLEVDEDGRDPQRLCTSFKLIRSDILTKFNGSWALSPIRDEAGNATGRTYAVLEQDILPAGAPAFLKHVPLLGNVLRGICVRAVKRMVEDLDVAVDKVRKGTPLEEVLKPPAPVQSHVLDDFSDDGGDDVAEDDNTAAGVSNKDAGAGHDIKGGAKADAGGFWDRKSWPGRDKGVPPPSAGAHPS